MSSLDFRFNYKRIPAIDSDTGEARDFFYPYVPCFLSSERRSTELLEGLLDSGSDGIVLPRRIADYLELDLERAPPIRVVGTRIGRYRARISIRIGRAGRLSDPITNVKVSVTEGSDSPIILGRDPLFKLYRITFIDPENRFEMLPYQGKSASS